ncbi:hypothetical protein [Thiolapillus sp.]|uniref:hypothetical protein n=1 Tax=Thiolapillus sp. TaxID=2017437 RepID=UPI0025DD5220|nr:hypothetical protein [Thiolapillus sp.]
MGTQPVGSSCQHPQQITHQAQVVRFDAADLQAVGQGQYQATIDWGPSVSSAS